MVNTDIFLGAGLWQQRQAGWQASQEAGSSGQGWCGWVWVSPGCQRWLMAGVRAGLCCTNRTALPAQQLDEHEIADAALPKPAPLGWSRAAIHVELGPGAQALPCPLHFPLASLFASRPFWKFFLPFNHNDSMIL